MTDLRSIRIRDGEAALKLREIEQMFRDSVSKIDDIDADGLIEWVKQSAHLPENLVQVVREGFEFRGFAIATYQPWVWTQDAQQLMVWVSKRGGNKTRALLRKAGADWMRERGAKRMCAVVRENATPEATIRLWGRDGLHLERGRDTVIVTLE